MASLFPEPQQVKKKKRGNQKANVISSDFLELDNFGFLHLPQETAQMIVQLGITLLLNNNMLPLEILCPN